MSNKSQDNSKYTPVIGLEIHIQAKTKSKMFCRCAADYFGAPANTHVCPVCLGLPGALPVPNQAGIEQATKLALALNCEISEVSKFDRKNYFYPDLPKGYQISQYDQPIGKSGELSGIRIRRVHLEEDTGKSIHEKGKTLLDFNKSGVPLVEVVTEPDFKTIADVTAFAKLLKQTVQYIGVSDAEMQKGQMRFELNISLRTEADGENLPNYRVEVKNIGSISVLEKVIEFEVIRQQAELEAGKTLKNETRGLKDMTGATYSQRIKEQENDYRYFPEPDIPPFTITPQDIKRLKEGLPELPAARKQRYIDLGIEAGIADTLVDQVDKGDFFDTALNAGAQGEQANFVAKWLTIDIAGWLEKQGKILSEIKLEVSDLLYLATQLTDSKISTSIAKRVLETMLTENRKSQEIIESEGLTKVSDAGQIQKWIDEAIAANPKVVGSIAKNPNAIMALVGHVMRASRGQADPTEVKELLQKRLSA